MTVPVSKTYKLYVGGKFPRSESGRSFQPAGNPGIHVARASESPCQPAVAIAYNDVVSVNIDAMKWYPYAFSGTSDEKVLVRVQEGVAPVAPRIRLRRRRHPALQHIE